MDNRSGYGSLSNLTQGIRSNTDLSKSGADLTRGPNLQPKLPAAAWSQTWPTPQATLDLDFANDRGFVRGVGQGRSMDAVTFTRASNATYVGSDGLLKSYSAQGALGNNLLTFPQDFDNTAWNGAGLRSVNVIPNSAIAPDNSVTASKIIEPTTTGYLRIIRSDVSVSNNKTFSVYAKKGERKRIYMFTPANQGAWFDLDLGICGAGTDWPGASCSIELSSNEFYRCIITPSVPFTGQYLQILIIRDTATTSDSHTGDGVSGLYIWGAQLEVGSSATTYYPTNYNTPRFDWASTTQLPQPNLATNSNNFTLWSTLNASITPNVLTAPDGSYASKIVEGTNTGSVLISVNGPIVTGQTYTLSVTAKGDGTGRYLRLAYQSASLNGGVIFNTDTGAFVSTTGGTYKITDLGSGWYRYEWTQIASATITQSIYIQISNANRTGTDGFYINKAQFEVGSSYSTYYDTGSQIPTNTPLVATSSCNGLLIEESRTNRALWCRDATSGTGTNMLTYSEQFDNAAWTKAGLNAFGSGSVANTTATTDPLGGNTADFIVPTTTSSAHSVGQSTTATGIFTFSFYAKAGGYNYCTVANGPNNYVHFDLTNGSISTLGTGWGSATCTLVSNGWYRCSVTNSTSQSWTNIYIYALNSWLPSGNTAPAFVGDGTSGIYIWGAQLTPGSILTDYQATTTTALYGWSKSNITVAKTATGIDGVANAATTLTAASSNAVILQPAVLASGARTSSVYLKRLSGTGTVQVTMDGSTWSTVDLSNGLWNRIVLSATVTNPCIGVLIATSGDSVAMDFAQIEDGAFGTSPILTTNATVTRSADTTTMGPSGLMATLYDNTGFTAYGECIPTGINAGSSRPLLAINNADVFQPNVLHLAAFNPTTFNSLLYSKADGSGVSTSGANSPIVGTKYKIACSLTSTLNRATNGVVNEPANGNLIPITRLYIGNGVGFPFFCGYISRIVFIPAKTSPTGLANMTS